MSVWCLCVCACACVCRLLGKLVISLQHVVTAGRLVLREPLIDNNHSLTEVSYWEAFHLPTLSSHYWSFPKSTVFYNKINKNNLSGPALVSKASILNICMFNGYWNTSYIEFHYIFAFRYMWSWMWGITLYKAQLGTGQVKTSLKWRTVMSKWHSSIHPYIHQSTRIQQVYLFLTLKQCNHIGLGFYGVF